MSFDWNNNEFPEHTPEEEVVESVFTAKLCDALLFKNASPRAKVNLTGSKTAKDGYYSEGYYMLHPFYYLTEKMTPSDRIYNDFLILTKIQPKDNLESLPKKVICQDLDSEVIEHMPIVVFRRHEGPISLPGSEVDLSIDFHCQNDTFEFIGVYKASSIGDDKFKLTKIFNRFYFTHQQNH